MSDTTDDRFGPKGDRTLWHYTKRDALLGIIDKRCFWATSILYLNDSAEFHHVRDLVSEWIGRTRTEADFSAPEEYRLLRAEGESVFVKYLEHQLTWGNIWRKALNTFVISFSAVHDDLSQWRAYGGGAGGYAMGFDTSYIQRLAEDQSFKLVQCIYSPEEKKTLVAELIEEFLVKFNEIRLQLHPDDLFAGLGFYRDLQPSPTLTNVGDAFFAKAQELAARIKHEAFEQEQEWRLVSIEPPEPDALLFRSGHSMLIPYRIFQLPPKEDVLSLRAIVTGPSPHQQLNLAAVSSLCKSRKVKCPSIRSSRIPYRDW